MCLVRLLCGSRCSCGPSSDASTRSDVHFGRNELQRMCIQQEAGQIRNWRSRIVELVKKYHSQRNTKESNEAGCHHDLRPALARPSNDFVLGWKQGGVVCVWKADARGNMAPSVQYRRKNSAITAAVFCGGPSHSADALAQVRCSWLCNVHAI